MISQTDKDHYIEGTSDTDRRAGRFSREGKRSTIPGVCHRHSNSHNHWCVSQTLTHTTAGVCHRHSTHTTAGVCHRHSTHTITNGVTDTQPTQSLVCVTDTQPTQPLACVSTHTTPGVCHRHSNSHNHWCVSNSHNHTDTQPTILVSKYLIHLLILNK